MFDYGTSALVDCECRQNCWHLQLGYRWVKSLISCKATNKLGFKYNEPSQEMIIDVIQKIRSWEGREPCWIRKYGLTVFCFKEEILTMTRT